MSFMMDTFEDRVKQLNDLIAKSNRIVFFGGAGVSTESGIPDFRSTDGLYNQHDVQFDGFEPEYLLSRSCLRKHPAVFYEFYRQKLDCRTIEPNITHYKLAELEKCGKLIGIVTQNIDGLHQKAGSEAVYEIHGTTEKNYCPRCGKKYPADYIFTCGEMIPKCECGGMIRPDVTLYEENLPETAWSNAIYALSNADLLIIGGTSLSVWPAAGMIQYAHCPTVLINKGVVDAKVVTDIDFKEGLGEVFSKIKTDYEV